MTNPIVFTEAAVNHIKKMLEQNPAAVGFRLAIKKTGCSGYAYLPAIVDKEVASDIHFVAQQDLQVYVDPNALLYITELLIDYAADDIPGLKQKRLLFINPKETGRCGCGESFTVE